jgi:hypothetical protein
MKLRHLALCVTLLALFVLADFVRSHGMPTLGATLDVVKLLTCAILLVAAWRAGLRVLAVVGVLLFSLTACAPLEWARPDATPEQASADAADCQQRAWREAQWHSFAYRPARIGRWRDPFRSDPFLDETRLARFCMEARGYSLRPVER